MTHSAGLKRAHSRPGNHHSKPGPRLFQGRRRSRHAHTKHRLPRLDGASPPRPTRRLGKHQPQRVHTARRKRTVLPRKAPRSRNKPGSARKASLDHRTLRRAPQRPGRPQPVGQRTPCAEPSLGREAELFRPARLVLVACGPPRQTIHAARHTASLVHETPHVDRRHRRHNRLTSLRQEPPSLRNNRKQHHQPSAVAAIPARSSRLARSQHQLTLCAARSAHVSVPRARWHCTSIRTAGCTSDATTPHASRRRPIDRRMPAGAGSASDCGGKQVGTEAVSNHEGAPLRKLT